MNAFCMLSETIPQAIMCETVIWCGIQGSDKQRVYLDDSGILRTY